MVSYNEAKDAPTFSSEGIYNRPPNFWGVLFLLSALYTPEIEKCYMIFEKILGHTMKKGPLHVSKQESFLTP